MRGLACPADTLAALKLQPLWTCRLQDKDHTKGLQKFVGEPPCTVCANQPEARGGRIAASRRLVLRAGAAINLCLHEALHCASTAGQPQLSCFSVLRWLADTPALLPPALLKPPQPTRWSSRTHTWCPCASCWPGCRCALPCAATFCMGVWVCGRLLRHAGLRAYTVAPLCAHLHPGNGRVCLSPSALLSALHLPQDPVPADQLTAERLGCGKPGGAPGSAEGSSSTAAAATPAPAPAPSKQTGDKKTLRRLSA